MENFITRGNNWFWIFLGVIIFIIAATIYINNRKKYCGGGYIGGYYPGYYPYQQYRGAASTSPVTKSNGDCTCAVADVSGNEIKISGNCSDPTFQQYCGQNQSYVYPYAFTNLFGGFRRRR